MGVCEILTWFLSSGGAMVAAYALMEEVKCLREIKRMLWKRVASFTVAAAIAMGAFILGTVFLCAATPLPAGWRDWVNSLVTVATVAISLSQLLHASVHDKLSGK